MKIIIIILALLTLTLNSSVYAKEGKCKAFDIKCKINTFTAETKDYQKKKYDEAKAKNPINKIRKKIGK
jgi:hypothetical protein